MLRGFFLIFILIGIAIVAVFGFRGQTSTGSPIEVFPDMVRQMKIRAQAPLAFFADGRGSRPPVTGTVPIGYEMPKANTEASPGAAPVPSEMNVQPHLGFSSGTDYFNTGKMGTNWGTGFPLPVTGDLMERGKQRFNINCAICHGPTAAGNGMTKQYGLATVVTLQDERIRTMADGEIFNTITNGKNTMLADCFFWIIVHHVVDAEWSVVVRRQLENLSLLIAVMVVFFIPIVIYRHHLYEWMNIPVGHDPVLDSKRGYLNWHFFLVRSIFYFFFFISATLLFRRFSIRQDRDGNPAFTINMRRLAFVALPLFALSLTFGAYDWLLGIDYHWFSTMWGVYIFAGAAGSSMSLLVLVITGLRHAGYLKETVTPEHYHIMGKWMLAFSVFWAYIGFSQYMLIWYANMPEETEYFIHRNTESWNAMSLFLVIGRFFVPFAILLMQGLN